jgi:crotonobetainyl-CoA:carnitine CoA-transferase CaiB-like acyl-CoA transferase
MNVVSLALNIPGPVALSMLVADGAQATKVEPPAGDMLGHAAPGWYAETTHGCSVRTIDLRTDDGRAELRDLIVSADLLLTSQRPSALARLGVSGDALAALNPDLCWVEIVGDDEAPEVPGHDLTYQLESGLLTPPAMPRTLVADLAGAREAVRAALALLLGRARGGSARHRRVGLRQAAKAFAAPVTHGVTSPGGSLSGSLPLYRLYELADGWAAVAAIEPHFAAAFVREVGTDPEAFFAARTVTTITDLARSHDLPISALPFS